ncbi:DUF6924 domain-containing protein [Streptomyces sp. NPDC059166]|uniref:DUF6924 domain-containing protein n=1 Tax=Streptomyces sp. NPDC059166 TaxID=3346752 RepID=UPI00367B72D3
MWRVRELTIRSPKPTALPGDDAAGGVVPIGGSPVTLPALSLPVREQCAGDEEFEAYGGAFRVVPRGVHEISANLMIANSDFGDFADLAGRYHRAPRDRRACLLADTASCPARSRHRIRERLGATSRSSGEPPGRRPRRTGSKSLRASLPCGTLVQPTGPLQEASWPRSPSAWTATWPLRSWCGSVREAPRTLLS